MNGTITLPTDKFVETIVGSYDLYKKDYRSRDEHMETCRVLRELLGNDLYDIIASEARSIIEGR